MKTIIRVAFLVALGLTAWLHAEPVVPSPVITAVDPATPNGLRRLADGLHVLDNGTPTTFFDMAHGQWLGGVTSQLYRIWYTSLEFGGAQPMTVNGQAQFVTGLRVHPGEYLLDHNRLIHDFFSTDALRAGLLKYTAVGFFYSRDWSQNLNLYGPFAGFELRFR